MITLSTDCLLFQMSNGESVAFSSDMISVELIGDTAQSLDPELVKQAAKAVFHYFKHELGCQTVTLGEFAAALEKLPECEAPPIDMRVFNPECWRFNCCSEGKLIWSS